MSRVSINTRRIDVSADVPDALAANARRVVRTLRGRRMRSQAAAARTGPLVLAKRLPSLDVEHHDGGEAIPLIEELMGQRSQREALAGTAATNDLASEVDRTYWYHTIELPEGIVTPGYFDHRPLLPHYGLPKDLDGKRVLDLATFDGFWAYEFEKRGGDVTAVDVPRMTDCDLPPPVREAIERSGLDLETGLGFQIAHDALKSKVRRVEQSIYDLDPVDLATFDFVHIADVLVHMERPLEALRAVRRMTKGWALVADCFDPSLRGRVATYHGGWRGFTWWVHSLDALAQMILDAGFAEVRVHNVYSLPYRDEPVGPWRACLIAST